MSVTTKVKQELTSVTYYVCQTCNKEYKVFEEASRCCVKVNKPKYAIGDIVKIDRYYENSVVDHYKITSIRHSFGSVIYVLDGFGVYYENEDMSLYMSKDDSEKEKEKLISIIKDEYKGCNYDVCWDAIGGEWEMSISSSDLN